MAYNKYIFETEVNENNLFNYELGQIDKYIFIDSWNLKKINFNKIIVTLYWMLIQSIYSLWRTLPYLCKVSSRSCFI